MSVPQFGPMGRRQQYDSLDHVPDKWIDDLETVEDKECHVPLQTNAHFYYCGDHCCCLYQ